MTPRGVITRGKFKIGYEFIYEDVRWVVKKMDCIHDTVVCQRVMDASVEKFYKISKLTTDNSSDIAFWNSHTYVDGFCKHCGEKEQTQKFKTYAEWRENFFVNIYAKIGEQEAKEVSEMFDIVELKQVVHCGVDFGDIKKELSVVVSHVLGAGVSVKPELFDIYKRSFM